jgi:hypothetical protein
VPTRQAAKLTAAWGVPSSRVVATVIPQHSFKRSDVHMASATVVADRTSPLSERIKPGLFAAARVLAITL